MSEVHVIVECILVFNLVTKDRKFFMETLSKLLTKTEIPKVILSFF